MVKVVLFSGGRGSSALAKQLVVQPNITLSLLINGYDDGMSTGEVRRFLGDSLGPSDFRKNSTRMASILNSVPTELVELLDLRLPLEVTSDLIEAISATLASKANSFEHEFVTQISNLCKSLDSASAHGLADRMKAFNQEKESTGKDFNFSDCSLGNLIFAGSFLLSGRDFNKAVDDYSVLLGLEPGMVMNITNGENVFLVGLNRDGEFLASEGDIVDDNKRNFIKDFFLIDRPLTEQEIAQQSDAGMRGLLEQRAGKISLNPQAQLVISQADIIVYAPGTQHSSLLPSYITPQLGEVIAANAHAAKLLITNIQEDAEIPDSDAVSLIEKAAFYLREKGTQNYPVSALFTHFLINKPKEKGAESKYIPIGNLHGIDDPRLLQVRNFEDQLSGTHDADKILTPFIEAVESSSSALTIATLLLNNISTEKTVQTVMDMSRSFAAKQLAHEVTVFYAGDKIDLLHTMDLPFTVRYIQASSEQAADNALLQTSTSEDFDYLCLMECSGMYHGSDAMQLMSSLQGKQISSIWGSRRLSVSDVRASYQFRYQKHWLLGLMSRIGSHALSLMYLVLYGHFISDTLSGLRLVRTDVFKQLDVSTENESFNQLILCKLLRDKGMVFEMPVGFLPISPDKVKRTSVLQGLKSIAVIFVQRFK